MGHYRPYFSYFYLCAEVNSLPMIWFEPRFSDFISNHYIHSTYYINWSISNFKENRVLRNANLLFPNYFFLGGGDSFQSFFNGPFPASSSFIFVFSNKHYNVKKCPSSIRWWDSNTQPSVHESPPITTKPGLPPNSFQSPI